MTFCDIMVLRTVNSTLDRLWQRSWRISINKKSVISLKKYRSGISYVLGINFFTCSSAFAINIFSFFQHINMFCIYIFGVSIFSISCFTILKRTSLINQFLRNNLAFKKYNLLDLTTLFSVLLTLQLI